MTTVLYIDDDESLRRTMQHLLTRVGYTVATAGDGREGVERHHADPVDVIITDIFMPDQEGLGTIIELHREQPGLPIIAVSGSRSRTPDWLSVAARFGARRTLAKPFTLAQLAEAITAVLAPLAEPEGDGR